ncbi:hypothetical protein TNIN_368891 [Trichonephila inaurata madagascariensis]|uniref:Uncharacterized protein n=1 Tax=Trichonephila inaurata madagascariensis TaxID=2747483 RepID=A0A8X6WXN9_9ARAC|nr:hypothetical protein TNIN_368891 [Trichonephila inaurata madagascariensis]
MEFSKKFVLVPVERVQVTEHLPELDKRMKNILNNKDLTEEEKTVLYLQVLQKYTHFSNENRKESESIPTETSVSENQETSVSENQETSVSENQETESLKENLKESVVKTEKKCLRTKFLELFQLGIRKKQKLFPVFKASRIFQLVLTSA